MNETAVRHTNRFLTDLIVTMRSAAETARQGTVEQARADADDYTSRLKTMTDDEAASLRAAAEADVATIREWSRAEMERIRVETEERIAGRGAALEKELSEYDASVEAEIERASERVRAFERDVAAFCERLIREDDPSVFASLAAQMPDPPEFTELDAAAIAHELRLHQENAADAAAPESPSPPEPESESAAEVTPEEAAPEAVATAEVVPDAMTEAEALVDVEAVQEAAPEVEATSPVGEPIPADAVAETEPPAEPEQAAPPEAEDPAESELDNRAIDARLAGLRGAPRTSNGESTEVMVVGLVSVASIATFKRQLSRLPGVRSVGVSSGPDGEFVFTAAHSADTPLSQLIPALPGFQARVVSQRDGVLSIAAHDPDTEG